MAIHNGAQAPDPQAVTAHKKRRGLLISIVTVGALLLVAVGGLGWMLFKPTTHEVVLQPAGFVTQSPFAADPFAGAPDPTLATLAEPSATLPTAPLNTQTTGATDVAIYGGSGSHTVCDAAKFQTFMEKNATQAKAWVDALNADSQLNWKNGQPLTVADIPAYVQTLAPVVLMTDTLVTNHDFVNGKPVAYTSVLQAGTAVLADMWGVPRLQCYCGNPLTLPPGVNNVTYTGQAWAGFNPANVTRLQPPQTPVPALTVQNLNNPGTTLTIGPGSTTATPSTTTAPSTSTPSTTPPPSTTPQNAWFVKTNPPTPSADLCSGVVGSNIKTVPGDFDFDATNNSPVEVDFWLANVTWQAGPGEDPAYGGTIDSCTMDYIGSLPKGGTADLYSGAFVTWGAFEGVNGTGPLSTKINTGDGSAWSIQ